MLTMTPWQERARGEKAALFALAVLFLVIVGVPLAFAQGVLFAVLALVIVLLAVAALVSLFLVAMWAGIAVHEVGHLIVGMAAGFQWNRMRIGGWNWVRHEQGTEFMRLKTRFPSSGYVSALPKVTHGLLARYRLFLLGGPLASLTYFLALLAFYRYTERITDSISKSWLVLLPLAVLPFVAWAGIYAFYSVVPFKFHGVRSDALLLWNSWFDKDYFKSLLDQVRWFRQNQFAENLSDYDIELLDGWAKEASTPYIGAVLHMYIGIAYSDRGAPELATNSFEVVRAYLENPIGFFVSEEIWLSCELAHRDATLGGNIEGAKVGIERAVKLGAKGGFHLNRAQATVAAMAGDFDAAARHAQVAREWLERYANPERKSVQSALAELDALLRPSRAHISSLNSEERVVEAT